MLYFLITFYIIQSENAELEWVKFRNVYMYIEFTFILYKKFYVSCFTIEAIIEGNFVDKIKANMQCMGEFARIDLLLNDYDNVNLEALFKENIQISVTIQSYPERKLKKYLTVEKSNINVLPNRMEELYNNIDKEYHVRVKILFRCQGYVGSNCHIDDEINHPDFYLEPVHKRYYCKEGHECTDLKCDDNWVCKNNGICFVKTFTKEKYCVCPKLYYGNNCQNVYGVPELNEESLIFDTENIAEKGIERNDCVLCPEKVCTKYGIFEVCSKDNVNKTLTLCDPDICSEVCGEKICLKILNKEKIYYFKNLKIDKDKN